MPSYADIDLINLVGPSEVAVASPTSTAPITGRMVANRCKPAQRDSFSDLAGMMKAKKPYTPIPPPSPRPSLSIATNGMQFASRVGSGSSILSPLARPYRADGSVAAYLQDQAHSPNTAVASPSPEYRQKDMQRLESVLQELEDLPIDDNDDNNATVQQRNRTVEPLLPGFELPAALPVRTGPISPPTPAASTKPALPEDPVVRVTMHVWDSMGRNLEALKEEKRALETKIARLEKPKATSQVDDYKAELETQIGKLQYQNESNKVQKATMARTLSEKDIQIKQLQLDLESARERLESAASAAKGYDDVVAERDYLQATLREDRIGNSRLLSDLTDVKKSEVETLSRKVEDLQEALRQSRDTAANSHSNTDEYKTLAQNRLHQLNQREKLLRSTQEKYATEHTKVGELEDHVEDLRRKLNQVGDLQDLLREKSSECDRFRAKLKNQEKTVEDYKQRTLRASNDGKALRGAAHLVLPQPNTKLSTLVLGCSECYAKNITCDNKARCRHCTENNEKCFRWRCSLKHILGQCPNVPCSFPHESDGWLLQTDPRPQW
ncbi:hypothetical protein BU25DRAFT_495134 [Macroventuria anomochaeta]|uniref:Uncharacterized protein n=1 Tax=Macroventuria anomochaeta TaxID=301207 RepID=A0ACB6RKW8_9PLEO|nr:uncharacterized protein BU25DRAFT_495134 [Macroventuria anomochaeta]KAF2622414.1 hypothetical protein BU25DRAFT_495134 [Macroventuria anomochaeta]